MAYQRYINAVPYSKGASLATVLGSLFEDLRMREQKKQAILSKEGGRQAALNEQLMKMREKPLEVFRPFQKMSEKEQAEIEKIRAETSEIRSKVAKNVWDRGARDREAKLEHELRKSELGNQYLKLQKIKSEIELQDKLNRLNAKYKDGAPDDIKGFMELLNYYSEIEKDLIAKRENYRNDGDDDLFMKATDRLKKLREKVAWLQDNHPYGYLVREMMPEPEVVEPKKQGTWVGRQLRGAGRLAGEAAEWVQSQFEEGPEAPPVGELPPEPKKPKGLSKTMMYYGSNEWWKNNEAALDYLSWWVLAHPDDRRAMRKYQKLAKDPNFKWYFAAKGGVEKSAG